MPLPVDLHSLKGKPLGVILADDSCWTKGSMLDTSSLYRNGGCCCLVGALRLRHGYVGTLPNGYGQDPVYWGERDVLVRIIHTRYPAYATVTGFNDGTATWPEIAQIAAEFDALVASGADGGAPCGSN